LGLHYRPRTFSVPREGCTVSKQEMALVNEKCQATGLQWEMLKCTENVHLYTPKKQKCCHTHIHILKPKSNTVISVIICWDMDWQIHISTIFENYRSTSIRTSIFIMFYSYIHDICTNMRESLYIATDSIQQRLWKPNKSSGSWEIPYLSWNLQIHITIFRGLPLILNSEVCRLFWT